MSSLRRRRRYVTLAAAALASALPAGCGRPSALRLTSYRDPYFPETFDVRLDECAYCLGPGSDYHIVGRALHTPADGGASVEQLVYVHMFWKPWPGKTFADPTMVDATIRYALVTEQGVAVYSGTGFVFPRQRRFSDELLVEIEDARLRVDCLSGEPPELLGAARVAGRLRARHDAGLAVDLRRRVELYAGLTSAQQQ